MTKLTDIPNISTLGSALTWARGVFQDSQHLQESTSHSLDAELILSFQLNKPRTYLRSWPEATLSIQQQQQFVQSVFRRAKGEPVAYLTTQQEFWDLTLQVTPSTLIPRPDTEAIVEAALALIPPESAWNIADLGTGSGAIALALGKHRPLCTLLAVDNSLEALAVAKTNAEQLNLTNIHFQHSDWFEKLTNTSFHVIVSNPPYIAENDPHLSRGDLRFEPRSALASGATGLDDLQHIISHAAGYMRPAGQLLVEHGYDQAEAVRTLFQQSGWNNISTIKDIGKHERCTLGQRP